LFTDQNIDGLVVASTLKDPSIYNELAESGKSVVLFDRIFTGSQIPCVSVENNKGALMAVETLLAEGKKNIGFLTHAPAHISPLKDRIAGYNQAIQKHNLDGNTNRVCEVSYEHLEYGITSTIDKFFNEHSDTDAMLVANNNLAFHLMKYVKNANNPSLSKMAIVSFDDHLAFEMASPSITAIVQPLDEIASTVVNLALIQLNKLVPMQMQEVLPLELMLRESHKNK
jgi:LacI family transcriptional regulator